MNMVRDMLDVGEGADVRPKRESHHRLPLIVALAHDVGCYVSGGHTVPTRDGSDETNGSGSDISQGAVSMAEEDQLRPADIAVAKYAKYCGVVRLYTAGPVPFAV